MRRRQFLGLLAALAAARAAAPAVPHALAAVDRLNWWDPAPVSTTQGSYVALEWRYLAGRITQGAQDFGFVVSLADYNPLPPFITQNYQELLVMRQDFTGAQAHATSTYRGALTYDAGTATYSFVADGNPAISASWRFDSTAQTYTLSVATPELTLGGLLLSPVGDLIPEGGGEVSSGKISVNGVPVIATSDYFADWVTISSAGQPLGLGRLDMQTIRPSLASGDTAGFSHHWFCLACTLADDSEAWITAWEIVSGGATVWGLTTATGRGAAWSVSSLTEAGFTGAQALTLAIGDWQLIPDADPPLRTGKSWRLRQGNVAAGDGLDLELEVAPGQFIKGARVSSGLNIPMQESIGIVARGSVGGKAIKAVSFAVAESTFSADSRVFLPTVTR